MIVFVGTAIYTPFVKVSEQVRKLQAEMLQQELTEYLKEHQEAGAAVSLLERRDSMGILARNMASQLRIDVEEKNLTMGYQPQYDCRNRMAGQKRFCAGAIWMRRFTLLWLWRLHRRTVFLTG